MNRADIPLILLLLLGGCLPSRPMYRDSGTVSSAIASPEPAAEACWYDSAIVCFRKKQYDAAETYFQKIIETYPQSDYAQQSAYMRGYLYTISDNPRKHYAKAKDYFEWFRRTYPKSRYISDSQSWISVITELEQCRIRNSAECDSVVHLNRQLREENRRLNLVIDELRKSVQRARESP